MAARKLSDEDKAAIRASTEPIKLLGARYGVSAALIWFVRQGDGYRPRRCYVNRERGRASTAANNGRRRAASAGVPASQDPAITDFYEMAGSAASAPCAYCGIDLGPGRREVDHKVPLSHKEGPGHVLENLVITCRRCNRDKGDNTVEEYMMRKYLLISSRWQRGRQISTASQGYKTKSSTTR